MTKHPTDDLSFERLYEAVQTFAPKAKPGAKGHQATCKMAQKVGEEAVEVAIEAVKGSQKALILESADLIYRLLLLWSDQDVRPSDIWHEVAKRVGSAKQKAMS